MDDESVDASEFDAMGTPFSHLQHGGLHYFFEGKNGTRLFLRKS